MTQQVDGRTLARAGKAVNAVAKRSRYMAVLNAAEVTTTPDGLEFRATDLETWLSYDVEGQAPTPDAEGRLWLDAAGLDALKGLKGPAAVELDGPAGVLRIGPAAVNAAAIEPEDWPDWPALVHSQRVFSWSGAAFRTAVKGWAACCFKVAETTRLSLTGVHVEWSEGAAGYTFTTTNGYHLLTEAYGPTVLEPAGSILLEVDALKRVAAAVSPKDTVTLDSVKDTDGRPFGRVTIHSAAGRAVYVLHTIAEDFPDFRRVIPSDPAEVAFTLEPDQFAAAVSSAARVAPADSQAVSLQLAAGPDSNYGLVVSAESAAGLVSEVVPVDVSLGSTPDDMVPTLYNSRYLLDAAAIGAAGRIRFQWYGDLKAAKLELEPAGSASTYVVMPVRRPE